MQKEVSYSHIVKTLAGVSFFLKMQGLPSCTSFFSVQQAVKGYRKSHYTMDNRRPISIEFLKKICMITSEVCFSDLESKLFKVAFVLAFFGAVRLSELLPSNKLSPAGLLLQHVEVMDAGIKLFISLSKTDRIGEWINLHTCGDEMICT